MDSLPAAAFSRNLMLDEEHLRNHIGGTSVVLDGSGPFKMDTSIICGHGLRGFCR